MIYLLLIVVHGMYGHDSLTMQKFDTAQQCHDAIVKIEQLKEQNGILSRIDIDQETCVVIPK